MGTDVRPNVAWPLHLTTWCFIAAVYAGYVGAWLMVTLAAVQTVASWGMFITSRPERRR